MHFPSPDHLCEELSERQINGWIDYYRRHPFGELREDLRNALNCLVTYKTSGGKKNYDIEHFRLKSAKRKKPNRIRSAEELENELKMIEELANAKRHGR